MWFLSGKKCEFAAVSATEIDIDLGLFSSVKFPFRVFHLVLVGPRGRTPRVAPVMLDYKFAVRTFVRNTEALTAADA